MHIFLHKHTTASLPIVRTLCGVMSHPETSCPSVSLNSRIKWMSCFFRQGFVPERWAASSFVLLQLGGIYLWKLLAWLLAWLCPQIEGVCAAAAEALSAELEAEKAIFYYDLFSLIIFRKVGILVVTWWISIINGIIDGTASGGGLTPKPLCNRLLFIDGYVS